MIDASPAPGLRNEWRAMLEEAIAAAVNGTAVQGETMAGMTYLPGTVRIERAEPVEGLDLYHLDVTYQVQAQRAEGERFSGSRMTGVVAVKGGPDGTLDLAEVDFIGGLVQP